MDKKLIAIPDPPADEIAQYYRVDGIVDIPAGKQLVRGAFIKSPTDARTTIFYKGQGNIDYLCGHCNAMLAIEMEPDTLVGPMFFRCNQCKGFSEL
jgi:hypothetical protein